MITIYEFAGKRNGQTVDMIGKSTDEKPTKTFEGHPIINGTIFYEMDTKKIYMYDEEESKWWEV